MNPDEWVRAREIFDAALMREQADRDAFLDEACAGDLRLRAEIDSLFKALERSGNFIERPAFEAAASLLADDGEALDGRVVGPYIIRHEIGRGGMGVVYLADDTRLSRRVALKALAPGVTRDGRRRERLRQEARAAAALSHPGIATVFALEEFGDELYLTCEYVPGSTLRALVESGPVPLTQAIDIGVQLARALAAAHGQGIVHRDLKPENVMRTGTGVVKVLDFGIARLDNAVSGRLTAEGDVLGTPGYMAPEQLRCQDVDFRGDIFAFGVLLYEIASGSNPFDADTRIATIARVLEVEPPVLSQISAGIPPDLDRIVAKCLSKQAAGRYGSTADLVADLEQLQAEMRQASHQTAEGRDSTRRSGPGRPTPSLWWWRFHQVTVSTVYILMMYPAWRARSWMPSPWGLVFLLAALASAAAATTLRLHLWFTARAYPSELSTEHARARLWLHVCDTILSAALALGALVIGGRHTEVAMLLLTVGVAALIASFVIEPTASRAAFVFVKASRP